ncbi:MAG: PHB depolymerase family esterase [Gammaproteobacteria bacterium]
MRFQWRATHGFIWIALCLGFCLACANAQAGNRRHVLKFQHHSRYFFVHIPPRRPGKHALVINLHGGGGQGRGQEEFSEMDKTADKYGFFVVYPNGTGRLHNRLLTWNAGNCCGYAYEHNIDDVGFISRLLDVMFKQYPIDPQRVYVTGMSNGAMMSYYLAEKLPNRIAAIAPVAGARKPNLQARLRPMPIMHFHSLDDPRALYHGGLGPLFPFTNKRVLHPDIDVVLAAWARIDGCSGKRKQVEQQRIRRGNTSQLARKFVYAHCRRAPVVLWQYDHSGHVWPGGQQDYLQRILGPGTRVINANEEMWHFFRKFRLRQL